MQNTHKHTRLDNCETDPEMEDFNQPAELSDDCQSDVEDVSQPRVRIPFTPKLRSATQAVYFSAQKMQSWSDALHRFRPFLICCTVLWMLIILVGMAMVFFAVANHYKVSAVVDTGSETGETTVVGKHEDVCRGDGNEGNSSLLWTIRLNAPYSVKPGSNNICIGPFLSPPGHHSIVTFTPKVNMRVIHHIVIASAGGVPSGSPGLQSMSSCFGGQQSIVFSWAKVGQKESGPLPFTLPGCSGSEIGDEHSQAKVRGLFMSLHYENNEGHNVLDTSGMQLTLVPYLGSDVAVSLLQVGNLAIPPRQPSFPCCAKCTVTNGGKVLAFRNHGHLVSSFYYSVLLRQSVPIAIIGNRSTSLAQVYVPVETSPVTLQANDVIHLMCMYNSEKYDQPTHYSTSETDGEMCNQYLMGEVSIAMDCDWGGSCGQQCYADGRRTFLDNAVTTTWHRPGVGQVSGVTVDAVRRVLWAFHRGSATFFTPTSAKEPTIIGIPLDRDGLLTDDDGIVQFGAGLFRTPHGISVDSDGMLWVTDVGNHQVMRLDRKGKVLNRFGKRGVAGAGTNQFNQPTGVAFSPAGDIIYISDGYGNSRVVMLVKSGSTYQWGGSFGARGNDHGQFHIPHGVAVNTDGLVYVADRENSRVQVFSADGQYLSTWPFAPRDVDTDTRVYDRLLIAVTYNPDLGVVFSAEGRLVVMRDLQGQVLQTFGHSEDLQFPHAIAVSVRRDTKTKAIQSATLYVAEIDAKRIRTYMLCLDGLCASKS